MQVQIPLQALAVRSGSPSPLFWIRAKANSAAATTIIIIKKQQQ